MRRIEGALAEVIQANYCAWLLSLLLGNCWEVPQGEGLASPRQDQISCPWGVDNEPVCHNHQVSNKLCSSKCSRRVIFDAWVVSATVTKTILLSIFFPQKPYGPVSHTSLLSVGEQQEPCKHVNNHEPNLWAGERRRWVPLHGLCIPRILRLIIPTNLDFLLMY